MAATRFDHFEVCPGASKPVEWPAAGGSQPIELRINGRGLIEIIRELELPYALGEYDDRIAAGESAKDLGERGALAGSYQYPYPNLVFLPSQNLLGEPCEFGFLTEPDDPLNKKSLLLHCTCGIIDCWFLLASIKVGPDAVVWSDFCQFHRNWQYNLGPFRFDRAQYEEQLSGPKT